MKKVLYSAAIILSSMAVASCGSAEAEDFTMCEEHVKDCPISEDCPHHPICEEHESCPKEKDCEKHPTCEAFEHR